MVQTILYSLINIRMALKLLCQIPTPSVIWNNDRKEVFKTLALGVKVVKLSKIN
jgi:hypothetical protein